MLNHLTSILKRGFWIVPILWAVIIYAVKVHFGERYTSDSYGFYLLGHNLFSGNGYYSPAIRDFYLDPSGPLLSKSFPPLFPFLVGLTDFFLNEGMAAGLVINLIIASFSIYLWFIISKRISYYLFFIPFILPIIHSIIGAQSLWVDAIAGRSNQLTFFILLVAFNLLSTPTTVSDIKTPLALGFVLGMMSLTRFDTMVFCFALPFIVFCFTKMSVKQTALVYAALILTMLPWSIRNYFVFGSFFASDNAITVASTYPRIAQLSFFEHGVPMGVDNPDLWIQERTNFIRDNIGVLFSTLTSLNAKLMLALYSLGIVAAVFFRKKYYQIWIYFIISFAWIVLNIITISLTPYGIDPRYYAVSDFLIIGGAGVFIALIAQLLIKSKLKFIEKKAESYQKLFVIEAFIILIMALSTIAIYSKDIYYNKNDYWWGWIQHTEKLPIKKGEFVISEKAELVSFYTGWNTIYSPENISTFDKNYQAWLKYWKPAYLLIDFFDFNNHLAQYPHASVINVLDKAILLKINHDESLLTKQDMDHDSEMRKQWRSKFDSQLPKDAEFFATDSLYHNGIATQWAGFVIHNTPENQLAFAQNRVVVLPNGEQRVITEAIFDRFTLRVKVTGDPFAKRFPGLPNTFETIDKDDPFFLSNANWLRGVARHWAGFFVQNTPENLKQYKVSSIIILPTGEKRRITKVATDGVYINVYLEGTPLDGDKVGTPDHFKVNPK